MDDEKLKMKAYKTFIKPVLLFGAESWAVGRREIAYGETEVQVESWALGHALRDR